jgi:ketosteroid isomerase-like protein
VTKKRLLVVRRAGSAISFALPIYAQQKDVADPQTTQKILALEKAISEGQNNHDGAAIAALYTRDAVFVTTKGSIIGQQAIQKCYTDLYRLWHVKVKDHIDKLDGNAPHLMGTAGNELWATGEFSETGQGKEAEPIPVKGYWACISVRGAGDWKIRDARLEFYPEQCHTRQQESCTTTGPTPSPTADL